MTENQNNPSSDTNPFRRDSITGGTGKQGDSMPRRYIPVRGIHPNSRFMNTLDPDRLLRVMEQVWAMRMERVTGIPHTVKMRFVPAETPETEIEAENA